MFIAFRLVKNENVGQKLKLDAVTEVAGPSSIVGIEIRGCAEFGRKSFSSFVMILC
jgi:hypothetical protein